MMLVLFLTSILAVGFKIQPIKAGLTATVEVIPASYTVPKIGLTFNVNITVVNVEDLYGWALKLYYLNHVFNGTSVTEGPFLKTGGFQTVFLKVNFTDNYNSTYGVASLLCTHEGSVSGVNGTGTLATITFTSMSTGGPKTLHLADVGLADSNNTAISLTAVDGEVTVAGALSNVIPGDINGDGKVSLSDLVLLANAYGSKPGDTKWNPNADINEDGKVSLSDLVLLAIHYGQHYP